ncbi:anti-sigma factor antagonist [Roseomonas sp. KE2513]|uniref:STAS domain-containing protein n=1 Tax=Roseomonadaceae TaxID=3385906 RepID=UPI0005C13016|nr:MULTISPECIES: STAS domain-containing protein [Roseomonas]MBI0536427.1 anti-sigma factor antagonist [Roseomonas sp. KE2513]
MQITEHKEGALTVAALDGRLDTATAPATEEKLVALLEGGGVVADMSGVRYVSSAGLRVLLKAAKQARTKGVPFSVCGLQPAVQEVFEISGFDKIIPSHPTRAAALAGG